MKFRSDRIVGVLSNEGDVVGGAIRAINQNEKIAVAQGFGVKDGPLPLRLLAYVVPVLHLARQLPSSTVIEFYIALRGVFRANGHMQVDQVRANALLMAELIQRYVQTWHTTLANQVNVLFDRQILPNSELERNIDQLVTVGGNACASDSTIQAFIASRGPQAFRYMVEHAFFMRDPLLVDGDCVLVPQMIQDMQHVIMVGGPAEKVFHRARMQLAQVIGVHARWKSHQFFTPVGSPPTYHYQQGEPTWENRAVLPTDVRELLTQTAVMVTSEFKTNVQVIGDLLVLLADAGGLENFADLKKAEIAKGVWPKAPVMAALQLGWERLRAL